MYIWPLEHPKSALFSKIAPKQIYFWPYSNRGSYLEYQKPHVEDGHWPRAWRQKWRAVHSISVRWQNGFHHLRLRQCIYMLWNGLHVRNPIFSRFHIVLEPFSTLASEIRTHFGRSPLERHWSLGMFVQFEVAFVMNPTCIEAWTCLATFSLRISFLVVCLVAARLILSLHLIRPLLKSWAPEPFRILFPHFLALLIRSFKAILRRLRWYIMPSSTSSTTIFTILWIIIAPLRRLSCLLQLKC